MTNSFNKLNIISWNAQSIRNKIVEFFEFLVGNSVDIACVSETWLTINDKISHPDYIIYRLDRANSSYGGVAIIVNKRIKHTLLPVLPTKLIETIGISVQVNNTSINILSVYFRGFSKTNNSKANQSQFKIDIRLLTSFQNSYFICGDLNSRHRTWNCNRANSAGNLLYECKQRFGFSIEYPNQHTHIPSSTRKSSFTIDLIITNCLHSFTQPYIDDNLASDHISVRFEIYHDVTTANP